MGIAAGIVKWSMMQVHSTYINIIHAILLVYSKITHKYAPVYIDCFLSRKQIKDFTITNCKLSSESKMYAQQVKISVLNFYVV